MTGSADRRYVAVDGGAGAQLLARLARAAPRLVPAASPRHADLLIVVEPITVRLAPAVAELYRALPRPRAALVVGDQPSGRLEPRRFVRLEDVIPAIRRVPNGGKTVDAVAASALTIAASWDRDPAHDMDTTTIPLPPKRERQIATELAVVNVGPVQPWTAGPLRLLLACDGEQIDSVHIEAGYAERDIASAMRRMSWRDAAALAAELDPLAPLAGRLAYIQAIEQLQGRVPSDSTRRSRTAALALERAENTLWWLVRFAMTLAYDVLASTAFTLASELSDTIAESRALSIDEWVVPAGSRPPLTSDASRAFHRFAMRAEEIMSRLRRDRACTRRTRGIGVLSADHARAAGVTGAVRRASEDGGGDVLSRVLARIDGAVAELREAGHEYQAGRERADEIAPAVASDWRVPAGDVRVAVDGPRGRLRLRLASDGGEHPSVVEWQRPSAVILGVIPHLLAQQKLADAEVTLASLDLSMAEADG